MSVGRRAGLGGRPSDRSSQACVTFSHCNITLLSTEFTLECNWATKTKQDSNHIKNMSEYKFLILRQAETPTALLGHTWSAGHRLYMLTADLGRGDWLPESQHLRVKHHWHNSSEGAGEQSETWFEVRPTFVGMFFCALPHYLLNKPHDTAG